MIWRCKSSFYQNIKIHPDDDKSQDLDEIIQNRDIELFIYGKI